MEKISIQNRKMQKVVVLVEEPTNPTNLAFVMHGLGGNKEQPHIETIARSFFNHGYMTVRFDSTNTFGESDGQYEDATATNYLEDLEDVVEWAKSQPWYKEPFVLAGHSLGGLAIGLFAEHHPEVVKAIAPISTVVSGKIALERAWYKKVLPEWKKTGLLVSESTAKPGLVKRLKYSFVEDSLKYSLLTDADRLTMPTLLIVGEDDKSTPSAHHQLLFDVVPGKKELHIIKNAPHTFARPKELEELSRLLNSWLVSIA